MRALPFSLLSFSSGVRCSRSTHVLRAPRDGLLDPDLAVALGAGIQAGIFQGEIEDVMIMDPWKASLMRAFASKALEREAEDLPDE